MIIAMLIVPLMVVSSGAIAFSAFTGSINTTVVSSAGYLSFDESSELTEYYSHNTPMTLTTGLGADTVITDISSGTPGYGGVLAVVPIRGFTNDSFTYYVNVSNLAPGNWVELTLIIVSGGSVGFIVTGPSVGSAVFSGTDLNLTNVTGLHGLGSGTLFMGDSDETGAVALGDISGTGTLYATNGAGTIGSPGLPGYVFAYGAKSGFSTSLEGSHIPVEFNIWIGLSSDAGNNYQESSVSLPITVYITSDP